MPDRLGLVILLLTLLCLVLILELVRRRHLREKYALLWLFVGVSVLFLGVARPVLDRVARGLGISYGPTLLFLVSILFLIGVSAHLSWEVSRLEERTQRLAEELAIRRPLRPTSDDDDGSGAGPDPSDT